MTDSFDDISKAIDEEISGLSPIVPEAAVHQGRIEPGVVLDGTYRIDRLIGQGGMGAVYEAFDRETERKVAIKVIQSAYARDPGLRERFRREAIVMARVKHHNVVGIYRCVTSETGANYIVMEYVEGETLSDLIRRKGKLSVEVARHICLQILQALHAIHREDIIHRDLKPGNIILTESARGYVVRICDFGLGKILEPEDAAHARTELTLVGNAVGTPKYMSPEQWRGEKISEASDLYSVGILLFEMLTGRPPYEGSGAHTIRAQHLSGSVPLHRFGTEVPKGMRGVISKALAKEVADRYRNVLPMLRDLNAVRHSARPGKSRVGLIAVVATVALAVAGSVAYVARNHADAIRPETVVTRSAPKELSPPSDRPQRNGKVAEPTPVAVPPPSETKEPHGASAPTENPIETEWPNDPAELLAIAQSFGDAGDAESRTEALRRFLAVCASRQSSACSPANRNFARARIGKR